MAVTSGMCQSRSQMSHPRERDWLNATAPMAISVGAERRRSLSALSQRPPRRSNGPARRPPTMTQATRDTRVAVSSRKIRVSKRTLSRSNATTALSSMEKRAGLPPALSARSDVQTMTGRR